MTGLTVVTAIVVLGVLIGRVSYGRAMAIGAATPSGAALILGPTLVVPTFYAAAIVAATALGLGVLGFGRLRAKECQRLPPGAVLLMIFLGWSAMVTLVAPLLFDGMQVVHPVTRELHAGTLTSSNIAQLSYLMLGLCAVVVLARSPDAGPGLLGMALGLTLALDFIRYASIHLGFPFPNGFFDSSPSFTYISTAAGGLQRFRGIHSEPAALASACVTGIAYFSLRAPTVVGWRRVGCWLIVGAATWMGVVSTSATFVVAGALSAGVFMTVVGVRFASRRAVATVSVGLAGCAALVAVVVFSPGVIAFVQSTINGKIGSSSYGTRSSLDSRSLGVFLDTDGFGVGLGSARGSSFLPTLLSAVGIVGTLLLAALIITIVVAARGDKASRPVVWALIAFLIVKLTSSPDLSGPDATLWLSLGVLSRAALRSGPQVGGLPTSLGGRSASAPKVAVGD